MHFFSRLILVLVIVVSKSTTAQELSLQIGGLVGLSNSKTFNEYRDYYNSVNAGTLDKELNKGVFNYGTNLQLNVAFNKYFSALSFSNVFNVSKATFPNGASREVLFNNRYYNILIGYKSLHAVGNTELTVCTGFFISDYIMHGYVIYPNGEKDYLKNSLSGIYQTQGFGIPLLFQYSRSLGISNCWIYGKCQIQAINATKFGVFDYLGLEKQVKDDAKRVLFEIGLEYKFK
jgi:hypothetical protein